MKKLIAIQVIVLLAFCSKAQISRDNILGKYNVRTQADGAGPVWWDTLIVSKHPTQINQIFIWEANNGGGNYYIYDSTNATFYEPNFPSLMYGEFYSNDSIFDHDHLFNSTAPFYHEYWGFKESLTNINEISIKENNYTIYPNPISSLLNIQSKIIVGNALIKIIDVSGREVYSLNEEIKNKGQTISINTSLLDKGIYFLLIENESKLFSKKIVIQ